MRCAAATSLSAYRHDRGPPRPRRGPRGLRDRRSDRALAARRQERERGGAACRHEPATGDRDPQPRPPAPRRRLQSRANPGDRGLVRLRNAGVGSAEAVVERVISGSSPGRARRSGGRGRGRGASGRCRSRRRSRWRSRRRTDRPTRTAAAPRVLRDAGRRARREVQVRESGSASRLGMARQRGERRVVPDLPAGVVAQQVRGDRGQPGARAAGGSSRDQVGAQERLGGEVLGGGAIAEPVGEIAVDGGELGVEERVEVHPHSYNVGAAARVP